MSNVRTVLAVGLVALVAGVAASGQSGAPPVDPTVAELRSLKADLNERLETNIRVQLLVARLQLQEQRTNVVVRQLSEVSEKLRANEQTKAQVEGLTKMFGGLDAVKAEDDENFLTATIRGQIEQVAKADVDLKQQHAELTTALAQEQTRWAAFNTKLEELERLFERRK